VHPLAEHATARYRFRSGDTLTISLPDGQVVRVAELQVLPRERSPQLVTGALWIEPTSGSIVQAVYRLARDFDLMRDADEDEDLRFMPGLLRPIEFQLDIAVVEYSLWNMRHWLPRLMRLDGTMRAGVVRAPFSTEIAYDIQNVWSSPPGPESARDTMAARLTADSVLAAWAAESPEGSLRSSIQSIRKDRPLRLLRPRDPAVLIDSPDLPPPIWRDAAEFVSGAELRALEKALERIPLPGLVTPFEADWSIAAPSRMRYNRVEGLSVAATAEARYEPYSLGGTVRLGTADRVPNAELALARTTRRHALALSGFHSLRSVDDGDRTLGFGASAAALLFGRDDGHYFRATGTALTLRPAELRRQSWSVAVELARHAAVQRNTGWSVPSLWSESSGFGEVIAAEPGTAVTGTVVLAPWWGIDPRGVQGGGELLVQGATGDFEFGRARLTLRGVAPLFGGLRLGAEAAAGGSNGTPPIQRHWFLGGPATLRGYPGGAAIGPDFARGRLDIARRTAGAGLTLFSDFGWAGDRATASMEDALVSAGIGVSILDGLLRFDLARALRRPTGWRLELYLDALL
jgi:hypothetical protein